MRSIGRIVIAAAAACGLSITACGGSGSSFSAGLGPITVTAFSPTTVPGGLPTAFTINGTGYGATAGATAQVVFHALGGATPFQSGATDTDIVLATIVNDTTITGITPAATVCGVASIAFEVTVVIESGVTSNTFAGGGLVFTAPTITSIAPNPIPSEIQTSITITGTGYGPVGGTATVRFVSDGIAVLFGDGAEPEAVAQGSITSTTTIVVDAPLAAVCGVASLTASVQVTLDANESCSALAAGVLTYVAPTIVSINNPSVPAMTPGTFVITGTGFGPVGGVVELTFSGTAGATIFDNGTQATTVVSGTITSSTTITGTYPAATVCPGPTVTATVRGDFDAGSCANSPAAFVTYRGPVLTSITTAQVGNALRETIPTAFTLTGTDLGFIAVNFPIEVRFLGGGTLYQVDANGVGTATSDTVVGIANITTVTGTSPVIQATAAVPVGTLVQVFYPDGSCSNTLAVTWAPPPILTIVTNANGPFNPAAVGTIQNDRFLGVVSTQMNIVGTSFVTGATVRIFNTALGDAFLIGAGSLSAPVTNVPALITGQSPVDPALSGTVPATVRVTNPDGQVGEALTQFVTSAVRPNFNASVDTGTNSENHMAVNPVNPLNAVALAHTIAPGPGFVNLLASVTVNGGLTWFPVLIGNTQDAIVHTFRGDPMVAFDTFGNCYMNYIATGGGTDRMMLIQFAPVGGVVTAAILSAVAANVRVLQTSAGSALNQDRCTISVGGTATTQTIAVGWIDFSGAVPFDGRCAACTSTGAGSLSAVVGPTTVASDTATRFVQHFAPAVGPLGEIHVSWIDFDMVNWALVANVNFTSDLNGVTGGIAFGPTILVGTSDLGFRTFTSNQPNRGIGAVPMSVVMNTGAKSGRIVITYADEVPAQSSAGVSGTPVVNNTVVVTQFSDTLGLSWSPKTYVRPASLDHKVMSWLGLDKANGNVYVTWKETADQPTRNQSIRFCAAATDGNAWNAPLRLSQGVATPFLNFGGAAGDYLEYEGIAAHGHRCYAVWADNANFTTTGATANPHGTTTADAYVSVFQHKP